MSLVLVHAPSTTLKPAASTLRYFSLKYKNPADLQFKNAAYVQQAFNQEQLASLPKLGEPEVIVSGRANAGKSTLLNMLLGGKLATTSKTAGHTKSLKFFRLDVALASSTRVRPVLLVDAPGYGSRGRVEWGELFNHYIAERKQLQRIYICFNTKHLLNAVDLGMLEHLASVLTSRSESLPPWSIQPILTKIDTVPLAHGREHIVQMQEQIRGAVGTQAGLVRHPLVTGMSGSTPVGVENVRNDLAELSGIWGDAAPTVLAKEGVVQDDPPSRQSLRLVE
ncbi:p-loop containing nucleoside triphosphate hydrolase protein [Mycena kentingensis (nom. inval.)]|nr:p-loop containing nucleoside triphosphate hydrolase protein [Mycena kentingensis (nom. inval.)]